MIKIAGIAGFQTKASLPEADGTALHSPTPLAKAIVCAAGWMIRKFPENGVTVARPIWDQWWITTRCGLVLRRAALPAAPSGVILMNLPFTAAQFPPKDSLNVTLTMR